MDGFQERVSRSIRLKLSLALSLAILVIALVAGVFSFLSAFSEAHDLQDDVLRQVAALVERLQVLPPHDAARVAVPGDEEARVIVQRLDDGHAPAAPVDAGGELTLPPTLADGLQTLEADGEPFRVLVKTLPGGERVAVAQEVAFRDAIARASALRTVMPFLLLVPVLLLIVANLVRKMFRPLSLLSRELDERSEHDLHPLAEEAIPTEVRPFVIAINRLLSRVERSIQAQHRFVADAAHELRSPLTALSLQAERLANAPMSVTASERLASLRQGIERGRSLLDQLLALAKAQAPAAPPTSPVSVLAVYRRVLEDLWPLAEAKGIDIGITGEQDAQAWITEHDLHVLVRNLVDNAIRYTPPCGRVDLCAAEAAGGALLRISDTGPGIPHDEREQVFAAFYRALGSDQVGSGLGLSIVKTIADRRDATLTLGFSDEEAMSGLRVEVFVPNGPLGIP